MTDQEVRSPEKERQILDGAAAAFAQDGYEGASMSRIAAIAGVSKGTLYNYFVGKKDLFTAFVQRECAQTLGLIFDDVDIAQPAEATLLQVGRQILDMLLSESGLLIYRMVVAEAQKFPELSEAFYDAGPRNGLDWMTALLDQLGRAGHLSVDDPGFAAEQLFALIQTRLVFKRRMGLIADVTGPERDRVVGEAVRLFLRGYGVPDGATAALGAPAC
jgi:TetR/AcrR family transcriptional repressor of mexJK operon